MPRCVLIVDDSRSIVEHLAAIVAEYAPSAEIFASPDVEQAVLTFQAQRPEVVFLDMILPTGRGVSFLSTVERASHACHVVVTTALGADHPDVREALGRRAFGILRKPLRRADVHRILASIEQTPAPFSRPAGRTTLDDPTTADP